MSRALIACTVLLLAGCSFQPPKPWQKGALAQHEMGLAGDPLDIMFSEHTYTSKEAAAGGFGVGGGGCGCN